MLASEAYANREPFVTYKVLQAVQQSIDKIRSTPAAEIARVLPAEFQEPALAPTIASIAKAFAPTGVTSLAVAASMIADMGDLKLGNRTLDAADVVDNRFAEALSVPPGR
jgi:hypothetical protein